MSKSGGENPFNAILARREELYGDLSERTDADADAASEWSDDDTPDQAAEARAAELAEALEFQAAARREYFAERQDALARNLGAAADSTPAAPSIARVAPPLPEKDYDGAGPTPAAPSIARVAPPPPLRDYTVPDVYDREASEEESWDATDDEYEATALYGKAEGADADPGHDSPAEGWVTAPPPPPRPSRPIDTNQNNEVAPPPPPRPSKGDSYGQSLYAEPSRTPSSSFAGGRRKATRRKAVPREDTHALHHEFGGDGVAERAQDVAAARGGSVQPAQVAPAPTEDDIYAGTREYRRGVVEAAVPARPSLFQPGANIEEVLHSDDGGGYPVESASPPVDMIRIDREDISGEAGRGGNIYGSTTAQGVAPDLPAPRTPPSQRGDRPPPPPNLTLLRSSTVRGGAASADPDDLYADPNSGGLTDGAKLGYRPETAPKPVDLTASGGKSADPQEGPGATRASISRTRGRGGIAGRGGAIKRRVTLAPPPPSKDSKPALINPEEDLYGTANADEWAAPNALPAPDFDVLRHTPARPAPPPPGQGQAAGVPVRPAAPPPPPRRPAVTPSSPETTRLLPEDRSLGGK